MEFHKKRDFGELISDTFTFLKQYGKNYFSNYLLINGLLLILLVALIVIGYREFFLQIVGSNMDAGFLLEAYFEKNAVALIILTALIFLLIVFFSIINYSYPVFYMVRVGDDPNKKIKVDDILSDLKSNFWRLIVLFLGLIFIVSPILIILFGFASLLVFILIGIPIFVILLVVTVNVINFMFYNMLYAKKGFFDALSSAIRAQFSYFSSRKKGPFWKYVGSTFIIYIIVNVLSSIFSLIPVMYMWGVMFTNPESLQDVNTNNPFSGEFGLIFFMLYGVAILASIIFSNLLYINAGFLYFDHRTDLHRNKDLEAIQSIGQNNE